ncbi:FAFR476Cp [Eremothecium gossypii FDAG1]|nr:FAFR476Cp [Eremothecium gossypii FDAG1]
MNFLLFIFVLSASAQMLASRPPRHTLETTAFTTKTSTIFLDGKVIVAVTPMYRSIIYVENCSAAGSSAPPSRFTTLAPKESSYVESPSSYISSTSSSVSNTVLQVPTVSSHVPVTNSHIPVISSQVPPASSQVATISTYIPGTISHVTSTSSQAATISSKVLTTSSCSLCASSRVLSTCLHDHCNMSHIETAASHTLNTFPHATAVSSNDPGIPSYAPSGSLPDLQETTTTLFVHCSSSHDASLPKVSKSDPPSISTITVW